MHMYPNTLVAPLDLDDRKMHLKKNSIRSCAEDKRSPSSTMLIGFDWGTNKSCLKASAAGSNEIVLNEIIPTVVGYAHDGIVENLLPGNVKVMYGEEALKNRLHLRLVQPMVDGVIEDLSAARDFAKHLRTLIETEAGTELKAVIGLPANVGRSARENLRQAVAELFDRVILVPEPFLAALGFRDESRLGQENYVDPVSNSLFVDIGGGTTDVCLVQGYFPTAEDQLSLQFAGDKVDALINEALKQAYPDCALSMIKIRAIKEQHAYVGKLDKPILINVVIGGKMRQLDLTQAIGDACTELLRRIFEAVKAIIARASTDSVAELMQNIVLTGGGSRIAGLDAELQRMLLEEGYENPRVHVAGEHYKEYVALGGLRAARQAKETQWQQVIA